jgi:hypothetical protein
MRTKVAWTRRRVPFENSTLPCAGSLDVTTEVKEEASPRSQKTDTFDLDQRWQADTQMVRRANLARLNIAAIGPGSEEFQASTGGGLEKERTK